MIRKYFDGCDKARELFSMVENYVNKADLRDVIEYELDYRDRTRQADIDWEVERRTKDLKSDLESAYSKIAELEAKLKEHGIE